MHQLANKVNCYIFAGGKHKVNKTIKVFIIKKEDDIYYGAYEILEVVDSEEKANEIIKQNPDYMYDSYTVS